MEASREGRLEIARYLVQHGSDIDARDKKNKTALMIAAVKMFSHVIVDYLLQQGCDLNARDSENKTAIMLAFEYGCSESANHLIAKRADFNSKDKNEALISAARNGHNDMLEYLVENGANVNCRGEENQTALMCASRECHLEMVKYLLENGADINAKDENNKTALLLASEKSYLEIVKYLVEHGAV